MIEFTSADDNDICKAVVNLKPDVIIMSAILENKNIVTTFSSNPSVQREINNIEDFQNDDSLRDIVSECSRFFIDLSKKRKRNEYILVKGGKTSILVVPLSINDNPNRILGTIYFAQSSINEECKLIELISKYVKDIRI